MHEQRVDKTAPASDETLDQREAREFDVDVVVEVVVVVLEEVVVVGVFEEEVLVVFEVGVLDVFEDVVLVVFEEEVLVVFGEVVLEVSEYIRFLLCSLAERWSAYWMSVGSVFGSELKL
jgi:hypothetical protein